MAFASLLLHGLGHVSERLSSGGCVLTGHLHLTAPLHMHGKWRGSPATEAVGCDEKR